LCSQADSKIVDIYENISVTLIITVSMVSVNTKQPKKIYHNITVTLIITVSIVSGNTKQPRNIYQNITVTL